MPQENVFRNRNFVLVFWGHAVSSIGATLYSFAAGFHILALSGNNSVIQGTYLAVCGIIFLLITPLGGVLSDRGDKAKIMYLCDFLRGGLILLLTVPMLLLPEQTSLHLVLLFVMGIGGNIIGGIFAPAGASLLPFVVRHEQLQQANSYFSMLNSLQMILGLLLAGVLYALIPTHYLYLLVGACYLISGLTETWIRYEQQAVSKGPLSLSVFTGDLKSGFRYLAGNRPLFLFLLVILLVNFFFAPIDQNFLPYFVATDVRGADYFLADLITPELWMSIFSILCGAGSVIMSLIYSKKPQTERITPGVRRGLFEIFVMNAVFTAAYLLFRAGRLSINVLLVLFMLYALLLGLILVIVNVPINTMIMTETDPAQLGRINSVINILSQGLIPIAVFLAGILIRLCGSGGLLILCSAGFLVPTLILTLNKTTAEL